MHGEPFEIGDAARVLSHPDTPAAYVDWVELLPLTGSEDRTHLGNLLQWSHRKARCPLGASRRIFTDALRCADEDLVDKWMASLASTPVEDFLDHHVPFLRNLLSFSVGSEAGRVVAAFLAAYEAGPQSPARHSNQRLMRTAPDSVIIEVTKSCNFACGMCSSRTGGFLRSQTMPLETFGEVVRVLAPAARSLRVNGYGETALVPDLPKYLDCLDEFGYSGLREIITNLSAPLHVYEDLAQRGFVILASWDATRADLFEQLRIGAQFGAMLETLRQLGRSLAGEPERLGLLFTVQRENVAEVAPVVRLAADVGAGLVIFNMVNEECGAAWMEERFEEIQAAFQEADDLAAARGVTLRIPDHVGTRRLRLRQTKRSSGTFCDRPWRELLVRWDTEVSVCNMFNPFSYGLLRLPGPARDMPARFRRLWDGPNARVFRQLINSKQPHPYCQGCYFLYP